MKGLLEFIKEHKEITLSQELEVDPRFEFYNNFFNEYKFVTLETLFDANRAKLLTVLIISENPDIDVDIVYDLMKENEAFLYQMTEENFGSLEKNLDDDYKKNILKRIVSRFETKKGYVDLLEFYKDNDLSVTSLGINTIINKMIQEINDCDSLCEALEEATQSKIKDKHKKRLTTEYLKENWKIKQVLEPLSNARHIYDLLVKNMKSVEKKLNKMDRSYDDLIRKISYFYDKSVAIEVNDSFFGDIDDLEFRKRVLKEIYLYNQNIYKELAVNYNEMLANSALSYKALLEKYNINLDESSLNIVMSNNIVDLEKMIVSLKSKYISSPEVLSLIIQTSNLEIVNRFIALIDVGVISKDLLLNNLDLFNKDTLIYNNFISILNMIEERKINPYLFSSCQEIYLIDINKLVKNIDILVAYKLFDSMKAGSYYTFFDDNDLCCSIDTLLELGFEKYLENDLTLLNYSNKFDRLKVLKSLNMPISSKEELINVLTDDKFFIPDSMIKNYIYTNDNNNEIYYNIGNHTIEETLASDENSNETMRTYIIKGLIISKNKIYRILSSDSETVVSDLEVIPSEIISKIMKKN